MTLTNGPSARRIAARPSRPGVTAASQASIGLGTRLTRSAIAWAEPARPATRPPRPQHASGVNDVVAHHQDRPSTRGAPALDPCAELRVLASLLVERVQR